MLPPEGGGVGSKLLSQILVAKSSHQALYQQLAPQHHPEGD